MPSTRKKIPTRREKLVAAADQLDPANPTEAVELIELWLRAIHTELEDLNEGISMILKGEAEIGPSLEDVETKLELLLAIAQRPGDRGSARGGTKR